LGLMDWAMFNFFLLFLRFGPNMVAGPAAITLLPFYFAWADFILSKFKAHMFLLITHGLGLLG
jgi:hypothetical protein